MIFFKGSEGIVFKNQPFAWLMWLVGWLFVHLFPRCGLSLSLFVHPSLSANAKLSSLWKRKQAFESIRTGSGAVLTLVLFRPFLGGFRCASFLSWWFERLLFKLVLSLRRIIRKALEALLWGENPLCSFVILAAETVTKKPGEKKGDRQRRDTLPWGVTGGDTATVFDFGWLW